MLAAGVVGWMEEVVDGWIRHDDTLLCWDVVDGYGRIPCGIILHTFHLAQHSTHPFCLLNQRAI